MQKHGHEEEPVKLDIQTELTVERTELNSGILLFEIFNPESEGQTISVSVSRNLIIYVFLDGKGQCDSSLLSKSVSLDSSQYGMMAFPVKDWKIDLSIGKDTSLRLLCISITELHIIFGNFNFQDPQLLKDALKNYRQTNLFTSKESSPAIRSIIHQLFSSKGESISRLILQKGKIMEFLSVFMESKDPEDPEYADCPYITDALDWEKIRNAEKIIKTQLSNPPTIKELARKVGTNEFKLKVGFKHLFKNTIYGYLNDYRMEYAREMLGKKNILIKEVSEKVGYSNTSHFIASFKKKFGVTPKQFLRG